MVAFPTCSNHSPSRPSLAATPGLDFLHPNNGATCCDLVRNTPSVDLPIPRTVAGRGFVEEDDGSSWSCFVEEFLQDSGMVVGRRKASQNLSRFIVAHMGCSQGPIYVHETLSVFMLLYDLHFCSSHSWHHLRLSEIAGLGPVTRTATEAFVFPLFLLPSSSKLDAFPLKACHVSPPRMSASKCVFGGRAQLGSFWGAVEFFSPCRSDSPITNLFWL